jgi:DNA-binding beta-propeller fold protein YncE
MRRSVSAFLFFLAFFWLHATFLFPAAGGAAAHGVSAAEATSAHDAPDTLRSLSVAETGRTIGSSELREPVGIAVDSRGFVYVADAMAGKVYRYSPDGESLEFERPSDVAAFYPIDVAVQESFILVLDYSRNKVLRYDVKGSYLDVLLSFDEFDRTRPVSITGGAGGRLITTDVAHHTVALWTPLLDREFVIGEFGQGLGSFNEPRKAAFLPDQGVIVAESGNKRLQLFSPAGGYERILRPPAGEPFVSPRSICVDEEGTIVVCDAEGGRVLLFSAGGAYVQGIGSFGGKAISPAAAAAGWDGTLYVADLASRSVLVYRLLYQRDK